MSIFLIPHSATLTIWRVTAAVTRSLSGEEQELRLGHVFQAWLATMPHASELLFRHRCPIPCLSVRGIGARTKFWIVYRIDEDARVVNVLRVWNATRDPNAFRVS